MRTVIKLEHVSKQFSEEQVLKMSVLSFRKGKFMGSWEITEAENSTDEMYLRFSESLQWKNSGEL